METCFASKETISDDQHPEESGWTSYLDDFFSNQKQDQYSGDSNNNNNILVSDAASFVVDHEKFNKTRLPISSRCIMPKFSKKLDMKRTSTNEKILHDDSLDDTASSPVNSPRIVQEEEQAIPDLPLDRGSDEKTSGIVMEGEKNDCTNMRKRGCPCSPCPRYLTFFVSMESFRYVRTWMMKQTVSLVV